MSRSSRPPCSIDGCDRPVAARGWCKPHYYRWKSRGGDPAVSRRNDAPAIERLWARVVGGDFTECWVWTGPRTAKGYVQISDQGRMVKGHRLAYEHMIGEIPAGLELDHTCFNRACVNPYHMDPVTPEVNKARSSNALRTHCKRGHEFSEENTYRKRDGGRQCRACDRERGSVAA